MFSCFSISNGYTKGRMKWDLLRKRLAFAMSRQSCRIFIYVPCFVIKQIKKTKYKKFG